jgi:hypothetical protein
MANGERFMDEWSRNPAFSDRVDSVPAATPFGILPHPNRSRAMPPAWRKRDRFDLALLAHP